MLFNNIGNREGMRIQSQAARHASYFMQISHMSLVYFASRFARTLFVRNQNGGGEGGVEKGKR